MNEINRLRRTIPIINEVSPSFCIAKWKQVTMHLQNGHTHSCHHPRTHLVPLDELKSNPSALHNTKYKKDQRKLMLEGKRPEECDYCWQVEDNAPENFSDRILKSADDIWALPYLNEIKSQSWDHDVDPSYVEVSFSNVCNFKCSYCSPQFSSMWMEEIEKFGPYPTSSAFNDLSYLKHRSLMPILNKEENVYIDAFWKWWPKLYQELKFFRITGGEPLLSKNTFRVLDYVIENPNPNLNLSINSNLNPPSEIYNKFLEKAKIIVNEKKVNHFKIFTSCDAYGERAEYIRHGLNYNAWLSNIHKAFEEIPEIEFTIMSTYNLLSIFNYNKFLEDTLEIRRRYRYPGRERSPIMVDIPYLRYPEHQSIFVADDSALDAVQETINFMKNNQENIEKFGDFWGFYDFEIEKFERIYNLIANKKIDYSHLLKIRHDFKKFVDEHDKRRGTNFLKTFPEFEQFYNKIRKTL